MTYGDLIRSLDPTVPVQAALLAQSARLFRGAGYVGFDGGAPAGDGALHAAVAAPYAHVTAPLRRLADRYVTETCLALRTGAEVRAVVTNTTKGRATVQVVDPAVVASVADPGGPLEPGQYVQLRVDGVDVVKRSVDLEVVPAA
jgi:hypothetical protein